MAKSDGVTDCENGNEDELTCTEYWLQCERAENVAKSDGVTDCENGNEDELTCTEKVNPKKTKWIMKLIHKMGVTDIKMSDWLLKINLQS